MLSKYSLFSHCLCSNQHTTSQHEKNELEEELQEMPFTVDIVSEQKHQCKTSVRPLKPVFYVISVAAGFKDAADILMSLYQAKETSLGFSIPAACISFLAFIGLTGEPLKENVDEIFHILDTCSIPENWPKISPSKEKIAIITSIIISPFGIFSESIQGFYFFYSIPIEYNFANSSPLLMPCWNIASIMVAIGSGLMKGLTDNVAGYQYTRRILSEETEHFSSTMSAILSISVAGGLSALKAIQDAIINYETIVMTFHIEHLFARTMIGLLSILDIIPTFCFAGIFNVDSLDQFFNYLKGGKFELVSMMAFSLSMAMSIYVSLMRRALNLSFYYDMTSDLNIKGIPDALYETFSWAMVIQEIIQTVASLHTPMYHLIKRIKQKIEQFFHPSKDRTNIDEIDEDEINDLKEPLLPIENHSTEGASLSLLTDQSTIYQNSKLPLLFNRDQSQVFNTKREEKPIHTRSCTLL